MGFSEQFAQRTLAEDAARIDGGLARWRRPLEIHLEKVITDGSLVPLDRDPGAHLAAPWSELPRYRHSEVLIELKMPGNHLDLKEVERALLRRQALRVVRLEESAPPGSSNVALWIAAAHLPTWLIAAYGCERFAPGCYWIAPYRHNFLWIAANELPLRDELVAFLLARSGRAWDEFARWVVERRPLEWVIDMPKYIPMSATIQEEFLQRFGPEAIRRSRHAARGSSRRCSARAHRPAKSSSTRASCSRRSPTCAACSSAASSGQARPSSRASRSARISPGSSAGWIARSLPPASPRR
jgi:hypothetical protein